MVCMAIIATIVIGIVLLNCVLLLLTRESKFGIWGTCAETGGISEVEEANFVIILNHENPRIKS